MATDSFKDDVIVCDSKKAEEIACALKQPRDKNLQPSQPDPLPKNASAIWFSRCTK